MIVEVSKTTGIGQRTIQNTLTEYSKEGSVTSPIKKKVRPTVVDKVDEFDKNAIRQKIHNFWRNREVPTIAKMLIAINEDDSLPSLSRSSFQRSAIRSCDKKSEQCSPRKRRSNKLAPRLSR